MTQNTNFFMRTTYRHAEQLKRRISRNMRLGSGFCYVKRYQLHVTFEINWNFNAF